MPEQGITAAAVPSTGYLTKVGEVAYKVSELEWAALDDPLANHPLVETPKLLGRSTGQIATALEDVSATIDGRDPQGHFLRVASMALKDVAFMRNRILHSRPGILPNGEVCLLYLRVSADSAIESAWIDEAYLDHVLARITYWSGRIERSSGRCSAQ